MLAIDDVKKLAKMQEVLLERTVDNREANLEKYKSIVIQIDEYTFSNLFSELKQFNTHNRTLEEELQFLELVKSSYQQLLEQQLGFKRVYELYDGGELQLSDLSQIDIEYIEDRINVISGYLINKKNIETNEKKLQELNKQLITEEQNRKFLSNKLLRSEEELRNNFLNAEGRCIEKGELQYISVVSEYSKFGYSFEHLLKNATDLRHLLLTVNNEKIEIEEKLKTAEICFTSAPSTDSKQILDDIKNDCEKIKYKLALLKILDLLSENYDDYELFKGKREQLLDLIKYRLNCMKKMGMHISIDPFSRTKVAEQLEDVLSFKDNSKIINAVKKEIGILDQRLEEMISNDSDYKIQLNNKKDLIVSRTSINDIDISDVEIDLNDEFVDDVRKVVLDNQVIGIKDVSKYFSDAIVRQKTSRVIKRVNEMVNNITIAKDSVDVLAPELVIVPQALQEDEVDDVEVVMQQDDSLDSVNQDLLGNWIDSFSSDVKESESDLDEKKEEIYSLSASDEKNDDKDSFDEKEEALDSFDSNIFMNVDPFLSAPLFTDKTYEDKNVEESVADDSFSGVDDVFVMEEQGDTIDKKSDLIDFEIVDENNGVEMPELFWVTQEEKNDNNINDDIVPSFDEQIDALLSDGKDTKTKKLVA